MLCAVVRLLHIKDLKDLNNIARHGIYRHAGPTDLKRWSFLSSLQGGSPQPRHRRATSPYNLANPGNLVNPAHLWLILFQVLGMARDRPSPYGIMKGFLVTVVRGPVPRVFLGLLNPKSL